MSAAESSGALLEAKVECRNCSHKFVTSNISLELDWSGCWYESDSPSPKLECKCPNCNAKLVVDAW